MFYGDRASERPRAHADATRRNCSAWGESGARLVGAHPISFPIAELFGEPGVVRASSISGRLLAPETLALQADAPLPLSFRGGSESQPSARNSDFSARVREIGLGIELRFITSLDNEKFL